MWFSGRPTTTSDQNVVTSGSLSVPISGSFLKKLLYADHHVVIVTLDAHLPQRRIAREERRVATTGDEGFDRVAHAARPVLVVADGKIQARAVQHLGVLLEIRVGAHADLEALAFGPLDEGQLPVGPTRRPGVARQMVDLDVADMRGVLRIRCARPRHAPALARRLVEVARRHRSLQGDMGAAGVQVRPAEVVVGVPRIGRQRHDDPRPRRRPHDEERVVAPHLVADVDLHDDLVVPRPPRRIDVQREGDGPSAPLRRGVLRSLVLVGRYRVRAENDLASHPDPCHLDAYRPPSRRRNVQADLRRPGPPIAASSTPSPPRGASPDPNGTGPDRSLRSPGPNGANVAALLWTRPRPLRVRLASSLPTPPLGIIRRRAVPPA